MKMQEYLKYYATRNIHKINIAKWEEMKYTNCKQSSTVFSFKEFTKVELRTQKTFPYYVLKIYVPHPQKYKTNNNNMANTLLCIMKSI